MPGFHNGFDPLVLIEEALTKPSTRALCYGSPMTKGSFVIMKTQVSPAIIMRVREIKESDLLVFFFARDIGLLRGVAKGARRSLKRFVNCFETFSLVNLEYETRGEDKPCFLHSGKLQHAFQGLRKDFTALSRASYMIELTELLFPGRFRTQDVRSSQGLPQCSVGGGVFVQDPSCF